MSYQHAPILILSARAHPHLIGTRPSSSYRHAPILILSARAHPHLIGTRPSLSCRHAPIHILSARAHPHRINTRPYTRSMTVCNLRSPILSSRATRRHVRDASARLYLGSSYACLCSWPCCTVLAAGDRSPASPQKRAMPAIYFVVVVTTNVLRARERGSARGAWRGMGKDAKKAG
jgi:hypothetical protein